MVGAGAVGGGVGKHVRGLESSDEDADIRDGSSTTKHKKRKMTSSVHAKYMPADNAGRGSGIATVGGYGNPWHWMQPL
jgi:hypothetical protein